MTDLSRAMAPNWRPLIFIALFSVFVDLLMLTGPLFMLQVYDRVLASRSEATLLALSILVAGLYGAMALLDYARSRVGARIGARLQEALDKRVFSATMRAPANMQTQAATGLSDVESVRRFWSSPVAFALFDAPFTPLFITAIFIFHPLLGWLAVAGGAVLLALSLLNQFIGRKATAANAQISGEASRLAEQVRTQPETVRGLGMTEAAIDNWQNVRSKALDTDMVISDVNGGFGSFSKVLRLFLQSAMLALGAWLVLQEELTPGAMIAGSILLGRALAPLQQIIGGWAMVVRARRGWKSLGELLEAVPEEPARTKHNRPAAKLSVENLSFVPPGDRKPILHQVSFTIEPGMAIGVIGESASGKSSLARILTGLWPPTAGKVRLDGVALDQFGEADLTSHIGYLPQDVVLFDGTIAQNIARMQAQPDSKAVLKAAQKAGAHEMILHLPDGYDTQIGAVRARLSGGQKQRIALARAMFGNPVVLVLDEPNANLDAKGNQALNLAIRQIKEEGHIVIVMAHRPAAISECDKILMMDRGQVAAFGPRDEVLRSKVKNHSKIVSTSMGSAV